MPGAYELQLISRYFGGQSALRSLAGTGVRGVNKLTEDASAAVSTSAGAHHHLHVKKPHAPDKKQSSSEEELMQVLFNKLKGTNYSGPAHQGDAQGQPGH